MNTRNITENLLEAISAKGIETNDLKKIKDYVTWDMYHNAKNGGFFSKYLDSRYKRKLGYEYTCDIKNTYESYLIDALEKRDFQRFLDILIKSYLKLGIRFFPEDLLMKWNNGCLIGLFSLIKNERAYCSPRVYKKYASIVSRFFKSDLKATEVNFYDCGEELLLRHNGEIIPQTNYQRKVYSDYLNLFNKLPDKFICNDLLIVKDNRGSQELRFSNDLFVDENKVQINSEGIIINKLNMLNFVFTKLVKSIPYKNEKTVSELIYFDKVTDLLALTKSKEDREKVIETYSLYYRDAIDKNGVYNKLAYLLGNECNYFVLKKSRINNEIRKDILYQIVISTGVNFLNLTNLEIYLYLNLLNFFMYSGNDFSIGRFVDSIICQDESGVKLSEIEFVNYNKPVIIDTEDDSLILSNALLSLSSYGLIKVSDNIELIF